MPTAKSFESKFARCLDAVNAKNESELAKILEINPSSVSAAKKRRQLPPGWVEIIAEKFNVNANWLFFGIGNVHPEISTATQSSELKQSENFPVQTCSQCAELKTELEEERRERRELAAENRKLWKENGELKERCARLEPRQKQDEARSFDERRNISGSSEVMQSRL